MRIIFQCISLGFSVLNQANCRLLGCLYNTLFDLDPYPWPHPPGKYPTLDRHDDVVTRRRSSSDVDRHGGVVIVRLPMSIVMAASSPDVVRLPIVTRHRRLSTSIVVMVVVVSSSSFDIDRRHG